MPVLIDIIAIYMTQTIKEVDIAYITSVSQLKYLNGMKYTTLIYDCLDFFNTDDIELMKKADCVLCASEMLYERAVSITSSHYEKVLYVPNACDFEHFSKVTGPDPKIQGDVIGYIGVIYDGLNQKVLQALAEKYKVLLVGEQKCEIEKHPNIYCAGHVHYNDLPGIMSQIKVAIRPIDIKGNYTLYQAPVKIFEYLASGRPVVASPIPELEPLAEQGLIKLVPTDDIDGWVKAVDEAMQEYPNKAGQVYAKTRTWDKRWQQIKEGIGLK